MIDWILSLPKEIARGSLWPVYEFFVDGNSRYFWLYCLTGTFMALYAHVRSKESRPFEKTLFGSDVWLSRSAQNDYFIVVMGSVLRVTILSWAFLNWKTISALVVSLLHAAGVTGTVNDGTAFGLGLLLTFTLFVVDDFLRWVIHYVMHRVPELWEFHKVHHSAEVLNFATAERLHPFEVVLTSLTISLGVGVVNGLFIAVLGDKLTVQTIFGANIFLFAFNIAGGVLRHSPIWISFGPTVERWIISPAMHQIHHSNDPRHFDTNMGGSLAVWDRLFGTLHIPQGREVEGFGIGAETPDFRSLSVIYFRPFVASAELLRKRFASRLGRAAQVPAAKH